MTEPKRTRHLPAARADVDRSPGRRLALLFHLLAERRLLRRHRRARWSTGREVPRAQGPQGGAHRATTCPSRWRGRSRPSSSSSSSSTRGSRATSTCRSRPRTRWRSRSTPSSGRGSSSTRTAGAARELHVPVHKPVKLVMGSARRHPLVLRPRPAREARRRPGHVHAWSGSRRRTSGTTTSSAPSTAAAGARGRTASCPTSRATTRCNPYPPGQATGHWSMHSMLYVETQRGLREVPRRASATSATSTPRRARLAPTTSPPSRGRRSTRTRAASRATRRPAPRGVGPRGRASGASRSRPTSAP